MKKFYLIISFLLIIGCATGSTVMLQGAKPEKHTPIGKIAIYLEHPERPYKVIAVLNSSADSKNFGSVAYAEAAALEQLKIQASKAGADGIIEIYRDVLDGGALVASSSWASVVGTSSYASGFGSGFGSIFANHSICFRAKAIKFTWVKGVNRTQLSGGQTDQLKSFLKLYCWVYESKDIDKFATFFAHDALENNKPFHELLPKYRRNMEMIESFNYRIDLVDYSLRTDTGNIRVQGKYFTQFLYEGTLKENSGNISMELIKSGESYLVKRLNYTSGSEKKVDKQPQWGPWTETGNKE